ncbi:MAG: S8 family serine peptidase [Comamonadaceae bacterium]|nr:S8 family serine peptidase [Comamonadaceae bacterium]
MYTHEDLAANAGTNPGEIAGNGVDDDGNGYVDDVYGWDFDGNNNTVFDGAGDDHGTHVAGTIGARRRQRRGRGRRLLERQADQRQVPRQRAAAPPPTRSRRSTTSPTSKTRHGLNLVATNNSWGGGGFSQAPARRDRARQQRRHPVRRAPARQRRRRQQRRDAALPVRATRNANIIAVASITSHRRAVELLELRRDHGRHRRAGLGHLVHGARASKGKVVAGYAQLQRHLDGHAARDRRGGAVRGAPSAARRRRRSRPRSSAAPCRRPRSPARRVTGGRLNVSGF